MTYRIGKSVDSSNKKGLLFPEKKLFPYPFMPHILLTFMTFGLLQNCNRLPFVNGEEKKAEKKSEQKQINRSDESPIREYFNRFQMPIERNGCTTLHRPHSQRNWSVFYTGRCAGCGIPSRINSASFGDTLIVSWVGSANYENFESPNTRRFGHISTFRFTEKDGFSKVNDFTFDECNYDMGSVSASPDGSVIGALCISDRDDHEHQNNVILYEWTNGAITQTPDRKKIVSSAAGGWNYGHWDLSLNNSLSHYYIALKTVTKDGGHQGMSRFSLDRENLEKDGATGCGSHVTSNRIVHNQHDDTWALFCRSGTNALDWVVVNNPDHGNQHKPLGSYANSSLADTPGGLHNGISLGKNGWIVAATGPFNIWEGVPNGERKAKLTEQQIGIRKLPRTLAEFADNESSYPWNWIPVEKICAPSNPEKKRLAGVVQLHNWGMNGEDSGRILMVYAPNRGHTRGYEFHAVEIDINGNLLHDPVLLQKGGWGIDTLGTYMPGSGCVVFPYTWTPDDPENGAGSAYPKFNGGQINQRSEYIKFTALCPSGNNLVKSSESCTLQPSVFSQQPQHPKEQYESKCPSF